MEQNPKKEYQSVTDNLRKLRGLAEDDISEEGLLKSRIEQQSELICILKQRADEYLKKYMEIENKTEHFRDEIEKSNQKLKEENKSYKILKDRFETLDSNHKEMIQLKDEFKADNARLRQENEKLIQENKDLFSAPLGEKEAMVEKLNSELNGFRGRLEEAVEKEQDLLKQLADLKQESEEELQRIKCSLEKESRSHEESLGSLQQEYSVTQTELSEMQRKLTERQQQKDALEEKSEIQGRLLKDQDNKIDDLKKQLIREQEKSKQLEMKIRRDSESLSSNSTIRRLKNEIVEAEQFKTKIIREFDAYKKHTTNLLNKEKELNSKLRRLNIR